MFVPIAITGLTILLFMVWFRYTCALILSTRTSRDYANHVAQINRLNYLRVQSTLEENPAADGLDSLRDSLRSDYVLVTYLLHNATEPEVGSRTFERKMLKADYRIMDLWYCVTRRFFSRHSREALQEMSRIIGHLANAMGEHSGSPASA
jgi:hypothetical protein